MRWTIETERILISRKREGAQMDDDTPNDKSRSAKIKEGIERAKSRRGRWGRPSIMESMGDPELPQKAREMRSQGLSWSEIAINLKIGKTTARRLVNACQKDEGVYRGKEAECNRDVSGTVFGSGREQMSHMSAPIVPVQYSQYPSDNRDHIMLPKTYQIFSLLLKEARKRQLEKD
jgi:hypothetical protein